MPANLSTFDNALREDYLPPLRDQLNNGNVLLAQLERGSEDVVGREAVLSIHVSRNSGVGSRAERGTLPTAGSQGYEDPRVRVKYHTARIDVSVPAMRASRNDEGAFARLLDREVSGAVKDLKRDVNRQLYGTSNGVIATIEGTGSTTTNIVFAAGTPQSAIRQLEVGMVIDIGNDATFTNVGTARTITANSGTALTITPALSGAPVDADSIVRSGAGGGGADQKEFSGLQTLVDSTGTVHGVAASTVWSSYENSNGGTLRPFNDSLIEKAQHETNIRSGESANFLVTSNGAYRSFAQQLKSQKRFNNTNDLKGGFKALSVDSGDGIESLSLVWDRDCPDSTAFGLHLADYKIHEMSDWEWMDEDGAVLSRVSGVMAYEATLFKFAELCTSRRNASWKLQDLLEV